MILCHICHTQLIIQIESDIIEHTGHIQQQVGVYTLVHFGTSAIANEQIDITTAH